MQILSNADPQHRCFQYQNVILVRNMNPPIKSLKPPTTLNLKATIVITHVYDQFGCFG